ncbi:acetyl-CoA carboxylase biotin carboxyl carrier protein [Candidatus Nitrospira allomarina]|jgi:acetyl-CoA carboxylase biotin carboxyl carrier protein|uniref:Biotin carboxyl carrier protein of acetyl-CoA carboxylase n=1 Tax=Candidatus Nitrospira allomarina TaxID=3020900 RepID=A0AA96GD13_9BACT|nr:acetyl-CoA carboxylase biotin carboxyl carrier protein [Candidatus Nitrospira allomarina]WNM57680.1 acetyl-CoA carboxylase biotin carboxyl carrier protein [Candidatus Nitrospira allomarina]
MADSSRREIEDLVEVLNRYHLTELEFEKKGVRIRIRRDHVPASSQQVDVSRTVEAGSFQDQPVPLLSSEPAHFLTVTSPIVGTFYRSPSPDTDPYVEEGDIVKKGQVLCIVEAMKLMNEIEAETDGKVVKILVESTTPVEFGQPLYLIDPLSGS